VLTMLTVYAAWVERAVETDVRAVRRAMYYPPSKVSKKRAAAKAACEINSPTSNPITRPRHAHLNPAHPSAAAQRSDLTPYRIRSGPVLLHHRLPESFKIF
jgi:hypothetical protein